jgi:glyoxylase-like metal-dependent hydrolase (beta-lactamase superfamily II)
VHLTGNLCKRGSWKKNWKERHFILRRDTRTLQYYKDEKSLELLGEVPLTADTKAWVEDDANIIGTHAHADHVCRLPWCAAVSLRSCHAADMSLGTSDAWLGLSVAPGDSRFCFALQAVDHVLYVRAPDQRTLIDW